MSVERIYIDNTSFYKFTYVYNSNIFSEHILLILLLAFLARFSIFTLLLLLFWRARPATCCTRIHNSEVQENAFRVNSYTNDPRELVFTIRTPIHYNIWKRCTHAPAADTQTHIIQIKPDVQASFRLVNIFFLRLRPHPIRTRCKFFNKYCQL